LTPKTLLACATLEHDIPVTAAEEDRARRKKAYEEQAKVRAIYEELVLKKPQPTVVQIGTVSDIAKAVPANFANAGKPVSIAPANGNGQRPFQRKRRSCQHAIRRKGGGSRRRRLSILSNSADSNGSVLRMEPLFLGWRNDCVWLL